MEAIAASKIGEEEVSHANTNFSARSRPTLLPSADYGARDGSGSGWVS